MPFALLIAGSVLLIASARGKQDDLFSLLKGDFTGPNNFVYWFFAILVVGAVGYIPKLKPISVGFLTLIVLVLFLKRGDPNGIGGGFFAQLTQQLGTTQKQSPTQSGAAQTSTSQPSFQLPNLDAELANLTMI